MRVIPTRIHGPVDYLVGVVLIAAPWIFGFSDIRAAEWTSIIVGVVMLGSAMMTNYEAGRARVMPMHLHLMADAVLGIILIGAPWVLGFSDDGTNAWLPFVVIGIGELLIALMSDPWPQDDAARQREEQLIHRTA